MLEAGAPRVLQCGSPAAKPIRYSIEEVTHDVFPAPGPGNSGNPWVSKFIPRFAPLPCLFSCWNKLAHLDSLTSWAEPLPLPCSDVESFPSQQLSDNYRLWCFIIPSSFAIVHATTTCLDSILHGTDAYRLLLHSVVGLQLLLASTTFPTALLLFPWAKLRVLTLEIEGAILLIPQVATLICATTAWPLNGTFRTHTRPAFRLAPLQTCESYTNCTLFSELHLLPLGRPADLHRINEYHRARDQLLSNQHSRLDAAFVPPVSRHPLKAFMGLWRYETFWPQNF
ncbi:hypothetical protein GE09DRAFT_522129 [Coniochaeta sp. 2T2.1]|nr:hypothetical protein GE09DRAFT_522129 [Coniochaeta sp. 2T2.1]